MTRVGRNSTLEAHGFHNIPWRYECYNSPDIEDVVRQIPGPGAQIAVTAPVRLDLQANNCYPVPDVIGLTQSGAVSTLQQAHFSNVYWIYKCLGSSAIGDVVIQSPAAGTSYGNNEQVKIELQANNC